jgi:hypothetical protein
MPLPPPVVALLPPLSSSLQGLMEATSNFGVGEALGRAKLGCDWAQTAGPPANKQPKINRAGSSYTQALAFWRRGPPTPALRPAYLGRNAMSHSGRGGLRTIASLAEAGPKRRSAIRAPCKKSRRVPVAKKRQGN